jgi:hypothetical protein
MALLVFSPLCQHSKDVIQFLESNPPVKQLVQFHDVNQLGIPPQYANKITRVPTLLTKNGKILIGNEVKNWLQSLIPNVDFEHQSICGGGGLSSTMSSFGGDGEGGGDLFELNNYGQSLQPAMTPELEAKINKKVA